MVEENLSLVVGELQATAGEYEATDAETAGRLDLAGGGLR